MPDMSYQEKSILGSLAAIVVVYGYYFVSVLRDGGGAGFGGRLVGRLMGTVILLVIIEIVYHITVAVESLVLGSGVEPKDERDILIESKAYRNAYFSLASGVFLSIGAIIWINLASDAPAITFTPFATVNLVLFFMVIAEVVKYLTQLFYYRWGVR
jgi:hypothetical protein